VKSNCEPPNVEKLAVSNISRSSFFITRLCVNVNSSIYLYGNQVQIQSHV